MLFKRRTPPTWSEFLRISVWPRRSWLRSGQYVTKRVLRLTATPYAVSAGVAVGAFTSFTPFMGLHFFVAAILAWLIRGNLIASALGTFVGNPLTFPLIWAATFSIGNFILQTGVGLDQPPALGTAMADVLKACWMFDGAAAMNALSAIWEPILWPMLVGGLIIGIPIALIIYFLTRRAAIMFRESRRSKLMAKATEIRDRAKQAAERNAFPEKANNA